LVAKHACQGVNAACHTPLAQRNCRPKAERARSRIPLGRLGEVENLIGMATHLQSPASDFCAGQIMSVDGGYTAG
jgi:NAD(P)-dependent dehydrogenase (short-subunit alcohol dehydrogenase family)